MEFEAINKVISSTIDKFDQKDKIGFVGFMGSLNLERDLDMIIAPAKNIKKGEFLKILCNLLEQIKHNLNKNKIGLVVFTYSIFQEEVRYISKLNKEKDLFLHIVSISDLVPVNEELIEVIYNTNKIIYGKKENLYCVNKSNKDYYYNYLFWSNCLFSRYPKKLETKKVLERVSYILKHNKGKIDIKGKTNKQIYFECCNFLDKISN